MTIKMFDSQTFNNGKEHAMTQSPNIMKQWLEVANQALPIAANAANANGVKKESSLFANLAYLSLQVMLNGTIQNRQALKELVSKEGRFNALRQCVSNAKPLAVMINQAGFIQYMDKDSGAIKQFTKEDIINSNTPLFSVATVYKKVKEGENANAPETKELTDSAAIALFAKSQGTEASLYKNTGNPADTLHAVEQGRALHAAQAKDTMLANVKETSETIRNQVSALYALDMDTAINLVNELIEIVSAHETKPALVDDMQPVAQAA